MYESLQYRTLQVQPSEILKLLVNLERRVEASYSCTVQGAPALGRVSMGVTLRSSEADFCEPTLRGPTLA